MEVSGKRLRNYCKPCEQLKKSTYSDGFCSQCEEEMCQICFDTHKQFKLNREHRLVQSVGAELKTKQTPNFDKCTKHLSGDIKFFCPEHRQVGCGDCVVISHKTCKVEYILEHIDGYKVSKRFKKLKIDTKKHNREAKTMLGNIRSTKDNVKDVNKKFVTDVKLFRDEMISHIKKLADSMLRNGDDIMAADMTKIENLEKENESIVEETKGMRDTLKSEADQPYKLFITFLSYKQNLHLIRDQLERIKENNTIETYEFKRDSTLEQLMKNRNQLGIIHKPEQSDAARGEEKVQTNTNTLRTKVQASSTNQNQHLLDRQLICKNLNIDGAFMSYSEKAKGDLGLFVDTKIVEHLDSFEIEIVSIGTSGSIAIGVVPDSYPNSLLPGAGTNSYAFHSDGKVQKNGSASDIKHRQSWQVGDKISCTIVWRWRFSITHNGKEVDDVYLRSFVKYRFAVGMTSPGCEIRVASISPK